MARTTFTRVDDERDRNRSTFLAPGWHAPRVSENELARAWATAVPAIAAIPARTERGAMFRIFWAHPSGTGLRDFALGAGKHLVIGRHTECDISLAADSDLSLRHLLVVPEGTPTAPAIRLVDLRAALPMITSHGRAERSLTFEGPFAIRLGQYVIGGFRVGPGAPPVPAELPPIEQRESDEPPRNVGTRPGHGPDRQTFVTIMPPPSTLVEISDARHEGIVALIGRRAGTTARVRLSERDLRAGVLIGRAEKCVDQGLKQVMSLQISRVHAVLLMDDRKTIWLYDAASTNGTTVSGTKVRSATLAELGPFVSRSSALLASQIEIDLEELA